jgi:hypothetical protein
VFQLGARGPTRQFTKAILVRVEPALYVRVKHAATAAGLGIGPFIRAVLHDYTQSPYPLQRREERAR